MSVNIILGQALKFACLYLNRPHILANVLVELIADGRDFILEITNLLPSGLIFINT